jgi:nicotinate-nucleotide pyrophosphorylase (carboxylating)
MDFDKHLEALVNAAIAEDVGSGDHSTLSTIPAEATGKAQLKIKEDGILAGVTVAQKIFQQLEPASSLHILKHDGEKMNYGEVAFIVSAHVHTILKGERLVLNVMQRMSGIATLTRKYTDILKGYHTRVLDTRKTTPNFRLLEKEAVRIGGGINHRFGLYDMIMLKDNHIDMAGGIEPAILRTKDYLRATKRDLKIEVETRNLSEVEKVIAVGGVDVIMLDNMSPAEMKQAVKLIGGKYQTEASGGITESTIREVATCGVDFISVGALTHSVKSMDLSLKAF